MSDLDALIERVEAATGPDREIDAVVWRVVLMPQLPFYREFDGRVMLDVRHGLGEGGPDWRHPSPYDQSRSPPNYTASLDAALTLVERKLPGWCYGTRTDAIWADHHRWAGKPVWEALIANPGDSDSYSPFCDHDGYTEDSEVILEYDAKHCSPALALISALLRALKSAEGKETDG